MRNFGISLAFGLLGCLGAACSASNDGSAESAGNAIDRASGAPCSAEQQFDAFTHMSEQPIVPTRTFAGVDLANGDNWTGLKLEDAERTLCQSSIVSEAEDKGRQVSGWGVAQAYQVIVEYDKTTHKIDYFQLNRGYKGTLDF